MKFYICDPGAHHKNVVAIRTMMQHNNVEYVCCHDLSLLNESFDVALCMTKFFPPSAFPVNCKVVYGPQYFIFFPHNRNHPIHNYSYDPSRFFYNTLSEWGLIIHKNKVPDITLSFAAIPLGLNMDLIREVPPLEQRTKIMIYFKHRHPSKLEFIRQYLNEKQLDYYLIQYGSYNDSDFKQKLQDTRFVIWIGSHESQGFAFQETQASNVPILVWNVTSMRDEFNNGWPYGPPCGSPDDLAATTANCWSDECGLQFFKEDEFADTFTKMNDQLATFTPRRYIAENLSLAKAYSNLLHKIGLA